MMHFSALLVIVMIACIALAVVPVRAVTLLGGNLELNWDWVNNDWIVFNMTAPVSAGGYTAVSIAGSGGAMDGRGVACNQTATSTTDSANCTTITTSASYTVSPRNDPGLMITGAWSTGTHSQVSVRVNATLLGLNATNLWNVKTLFAVGTWDSVLSLPLQHGPSAATNRSWMLFNYTNASMPSSTESTTGAGNASSTTTIEMNTTMPDAGNSTTTTMMDPGNVSSTTSTTMPDAGNSTTTTMMDPGNVSSTTSTTIPDGGNSTTTTMMGNGNMSSTTSTTDGGTKNATTSSTQAPTTPPPATTSTSPATFTTEFPVNVSTPTPTLSTSAPTTTTAPPPPTTSPFQITFKLYPNTSVLMFTTNLATLLNVSLSALSITHSLIVPGGFVLKFNSTALSSSLTSLSAGELESRVLALTPSQLGQLGASALETQLPTTTPMTTAPDNSTTAAPPLTLAGVELNTPVIAAIASLLLLVSIVAIYLFVKRRRDAKEQEERERGTGGHLSQVEVELGQYGGANGAAPGSKVGGGAKPRFDRSRLDPDI